MRRIDLKEAKKRKSGHQAALGQGLFALANSTQEKVTLKWKFH